MSNRNNGIASYREVVIMFQTLENKLDLIKESNFTKGDFEKFKKEEFCPLQKDVKKLNNWRLTTVGFAGGVGAVIATAIAYIKERI